MLKKKRKDYNFINIMEEERVEEIFRNSKKTFRKIEGMFKTTFSINGLTVEVTRNYMTIKINGEFYSSKINEQSLSYLKTLL